MTLHSIIESIRHWPPDKPAGGATSSTTSSTTTGCGCGACVDAGSVTLTGTAWEALDAADRKASLNYRNATPFGTTYASVFGSVVVWTHSTGNVWLTDTFTGDLGEGEEDYYFKVTLDGPGIGESTLQLMKVVP